MRHKEHKSILLVDDESIILESLKREMEIENYDVTVANGGITALELLEKQFFDVIVTDIVMPRVSGFEILECAKKKSASIMVLVLTGYGDSSMVIKALGLGADDFLLKPFDIDELLFRINNVLHKQMLLNLVKTYESIIPVCVNCRRIRSNEKYTNKEMWYTLQEYFSELGDYDVSRSCCPECIEYDVQHLDDSIRKNT